ncbi:S-adenosyl-L-methionine-dependent methyltransferase [Cercophora newfieldiana]|uniref:S-adenosyl-L-methionine-dependent methyltransferase n=1 Tax=Cercophora newfieldiana TaxID=92897 RepID=A0AA40CQ59_9PEZI|nr:S-adenosyl-L-methionine-dependent methyltransferase [Cercophora newfieldiana]
MTTHAPAHAPTTHAADVAAAVPRINVEALFDGMSSKYEAAFSDLQSQYDAINWVLSEVEPHKPAKIVDVGCGPGKPVLSSFAEAGHDVLGTDLSSGMLEEAQKNVPGGKFQKVNTLEFNPPDNTFDAVCLMFSLLIDVTQEHIRKGIANMYRIVKPGGVLVFGTVAVEGEKVDIIWMGRPINVSSLSPEEVVKTIKKVGFEVIKNEEMKYFPERAPQVGICKADEIWPEPLLWVYARKPAAPAV